jgi:hypothetical protein
MTPSVFSVFFNVLFGVQTVVKINIENAQI